MSLSSLGPSAVQRLAQRLRERYVPAPELQPSAQNEQQKEKLLQTLMELLRRIVRGFEEGQSFVFSVVNRYIWENVQFDPDWGLTLVPQPVMSRVALKRHENVCKLLLHVLRLLLSGDCATKRDHMYMCAVSQDCLDSILDDLAATVGLSRLSMNTISSSEGLLFGDLHVEMANGDSFYCNNRCVCVCPLSWLLPSVSLARSTAAAVCAGASCRPWCRPAPRTSAACARPLTSCWSWRRTRCSSDS